MIILVATTISLSDSLSCYGLRPRAGLPQGVDGAYVQLVLYFTTTVVIVQFITEPRTVGGSPFQLRPAYQGLQSPCCSFRQHQLYGVPRIIELA